MGLRIRRGASGAPLKQSLGLPFLSSFSLCLLILRDTHWLGQSTGNVDMLAMTPPLDKPSLNLAMFCWLTSSLIRCVNKKVLTDIPIYSGDCPRALSDG